MFDKKPIVQIENIGIFDRFYNRKSFLSFSKTLYIQILFRDFFCIQIY